MASRSWHKIIFLVVLAYLLHKAAADCKDDGERCDQCFQTLANYLVNTSDNKYYLRRVFYPLNKTAPVFVTVTYRYMDRDTSNISNTSTQCIDDITFNISNTSKTWYWAAGVFYFFQPLQVFHYTSLFFGDTEFRRDKLNITLPAECVTAPEEFMTGLTEMLKLYASQLTVNPRIDNSYQGKAYNVDTLKRNLYSDIHFKNVLYAFQIVIPFFTIVFIVGCSLCSLKEYVNNSTKDLWAITISHDVISFGFILYVNVVDIVALIFRNAETPEYYSEMHDALIFQYPWILLCWDLLALVAISTLLLRALVDACNETTLLFLLIAAFVPLVCLASHVHYIVIAWILDPFFATGIGIYYVIFYSMHLVLLKKTYTRVSACNGRWAKTWPIAMIVVFVCTVLCQMMVTMFIRSIPINNSIEKTPSSVLTIIQGVTAVFLVLVTWKVIADPRGTESTEGKT